MQERVNKDATANLSTHDKVLPADDGKALLSFATLWMDEKGGNYGHPRDIVTWRDYADKLVTEFDLETQSTLFGDSVTLFIEGYSVEFRDGNDDVKLHFLFHVVDKVRKMQHLPFSI